MDFSVKLTKRTRKRKLKTGQVVLHDRYVLNYRDPNSGLRRQEFFERKKEAEARQRELQNQVADNAYVDQRAVPTVEDAVKHWLADREGKVKATTLAGYKVVTKCIVGPLLVGTRRERAEYTATKAKPKNATFLKMLGDVKLNELTTAMIRPWHRTLVEQCGQYTANRAKAHLKSVLALAEEDFNIRAPSMPTGLSRARHKAKKAILSTEDIPGHRRRSEGRRGTRDLLCPPVLGRHAPKRTTRPALGGCGLRQECHPHSTNSGAGRHVH
ncbi:hypothetical protein [Terrihabitans sp. B22-R8]|uniref:hypothetical protein n=1 Tax=Terrihabitans sp. B22-R8 TaxID=3425128 RepID=UPI00403C6FBE